MEEIKKKVRWLYKLFICVKMNEIKLYVSCKIKLYVYKMT